MYTLVVVDMQAKFDGANREEVQKHCKKAIEKAIKNKADIVFLEFTGYGPTLPKLTKLTKGYKKSFHATKSDWSGAKETMELVQKHKLSSNKFRLCGVYTDCCVKATLDGLRLAAKEAKLELIHKACGAAASTGQEDTLKQVRAMKRARVVES